MNEPTADRLPPHSDEAEAAVLGCVLYDETRSADVMSRAVSVLRAGPDAFYCLNHRTAYAAMLGMFKAEKPISTITVSQVLKDQKQLEAVGGAAYIAELPSKTESPENVATHAAVVAEKYARRTIIRTAIEISEAAYDESHPLNGQFTIADNALHGCAELFPNKVPQATPIGMLETPPEEDPNELLKHRFLCRGGAMLLAGPTSAGKSSFVMQACMSWGLGRDFFGIHPSRCLRSLIIQAENDEGEMAIMRNGVATGLQLTIQQAAIVNANVLTYREDELKGPDFFAQLVRPLLEHHHPDLLIIDPAYPYIQGDVSNQRDVTAFCRNQLNPLIRRFNCGAIVVHHTNKPYTGKEKPDWQAGDHAYLGAGSAEWANWARAVLAIKSIGSHHLFDLHAGKRGSKLRWLDEHNEITFSKRIAHDRENGIVFWREADPEEQPDSTPKSGRKTEFSVNSILRLITEPLSLITWRSAAESAGISRATFYRLKKQASDQHLIAYDVNTDCWILSPAVS